MSAKAVAKPVLRGLLHRQLKMQLTTGVILSSLVAAAWHYGVSVPRKQRYAEFYK